MSRSPFFDDPQFISLYRLAEPEGEGDRKVDSERYRMRLPDGPRDIEAMYVLPPEQIFFVTKGRNHPVTVYRYPSPLRADDIVTLVEVQRLTTGPVAPPRMVTGASATLDGGTVAIRTYESLQFFEVAQGEQFLESNVVRVNLRTLREAQAPPPPPPGPPSSPSMPFCRLAGMYSPSSNVGGLDRADTAVQPHAAVTRPRLAPGSRPTGVPTDQHIFRHGVAVRHDAPPGRCGLVP